MTIRRVFYASAGQADIITSHNFWKRGEHNPNEVSLTFSGQLEDFISAIGAQAYIVSDRGDGARLTDGPITLEHRAKPGGTGLAYYRAEFRYCRGLVATARSFGADIALIDSGVVPFFIMTMFRLAGIPVVPILHNCIWPRGFRPTGKLQRVVQWLDSAFMRWVPRCILAVSPEAARQVDELAGRRHRRVHQIRAQFQPDFFAGIPAPDATAQPFQVMFIGRVNAHKGVLDIPDMAVRAERLAPGAVRWTVCGRGPALDELRARIAALNLAGVVDARGWTSLEDLKELYAKSHAWIVPTRSGFAEGLAMTAVEAVLAGRPIVSNPIVPALELLAPAAMAARSNDADSHADAVLAMAQDRTLYARLQANTRKLGAQFYDREQGLTAVLVRELG